MANLTITASQVLADTTKLQQAVAEVAITPGQVVYLDNSVSPAQLKLAGATLTAPANQPAGIAVNQAAAGQPCDYQTSGTITLGAGAAPAVGTLYVLSVTAGAICPWADLVSTNSVVLLGVGGSSNTLIMRLWNTGVAHA